MGGSSKTTTANTVPAWVTKAEQDALARAQSASRIGNVGYYGPDVAAMTPSQIAAMQGTNMAASAFGQPTVDVTAGMPTATNYGGMNAYSSGAGYDAALAELKSRFPGQFDAIMSMFINPVTGAMPGAAGAGQTQMGMPTQGYAAAAGRGNTGGGSGSGGGGASSGGSGNLNLSMLRANLPGGINTDNPESLRGRLFGGLINAISPQREPTVNMRPPTAPSRPASSSTKSSPSKSTGGSNATRR